jgi:hypothetical protein
MQNTQKRRSIRSDAVQWCYSRTKEEEKYKNTVAEQGVSLFSRARRGGVVGLVAGAGRIAGLQTERGQAATTTRKRL